LKFGTKKYSRTDADRSRKAYDGKKSAVDDKEKRIKELDEVLNFDYGPDSAFFALTGLCFSMEKQEYKYEICPFGKASQGSTSLGTFTGWGDGADEEKYSQMKFTGGLSCWSGPARTATVNVKCASQNKVTAVDEPSRCLYTLDFETPAACV